MGVAAGAGYGPGAESQPAWNGNAAHRGARSLAAGPCRESLIWRDPQAIVLLAIGLVLAVEAVIGRSRRRRRRGQVAAAGNAQPPGPSAASEVHAAAPGMAEIAVCARRPLSR